MRQNETNVRLDWNSEFLKFLLKQSATWQQIPSRNFAAPCEALGSAERGVNPVKIWFCHLGTIGATQTTTDIQRPQLPKRKEKHHWQSSLAKAVRSHACVETSLFFFEACGALGAVNAVNRSFPFTAFLECDNPNQRDNCYQRDNLPDGPPKMS